MFKRHALLPGVLETIWRVVCGGEAEKGVYTLHDWKLLNVPSKTYREDFATELRPFFGFVAALDKAFGQEVV